MGNAGLLLVGVVLLVNGLVMLDVVPARSAALLNVFVGSLQVLLPTLILVQNAGDAAVVNATWPTYLFGITYLYYGLGIFLDLQPQGLGYFSVFVAGVVGYLAVDAIATDPVTAVMFGTWSIMWALFFALMALGQDGLTRFTAWFLVLLGVPSCTVTAIAQLDGHWTASASAGFGALVVLIAGAVAAHLLARSAIAVADSPADRGESDQLSAARGGVAEPVGV